MKSKIFDDFEKVLVRDHQCEYWVPAFIRGAEEYGNEIRHTTTDGLTWKYAIPYKGNEEFSWTKDSPKPLFTPVRGKLIAVRNSPDKPWVARIFHGMVENGDYRYETFTEYGGDVVFSLWKEAAPIREVFDVQE